MWSKMNMCTLPTCFHVHSLMTDVAEPQNLPDQNQERRLFPWIIREKEKKRKNPGLLWDFLWCVCVNERRSEQSRQITFAPARCDIRVTSAAAPWTTHRARYPVSAAPSPTGPSQPPRWIPPKKSDLDVCTEWEHSIRITADTFPNLLQLKRPHSCWRSLSL